MLKKSSVQNLIFIVVGIFCILSWYFYRPQIVDFLNLGVKNSQELSVNSWNWLENNFKKISFDFFDFKKIFSFGQKSDDYIVSQKNIASVKDCGVSMSPDLKNPLAYQNDPVLNCLGNSALLCTNARAVLENDLFPSVFEIIKNKETCNFKLSYEKDSTLVDITGKKLAGQYISCPIDVVRAVDETITPLVFTTPSVDNLSRYAGEVYFYGTLGIFMENNAEKSKIKNLGCSGPFIDSIIASYNKIQSN